MDNFNQPGILGEAGWDWVTFAFHSPEYAAHYHNALWACLTNGLAATPIWWTFDDPLDVEASDEAGHEADTDLKIKTIEYFDKRLIRRALDNLHRVDDEVAIAVLPDHPTPLKHRTPTREPVPFLIYNPKLPGDSVRAFDEESVKAGIYGLLKGDEFIRAFLENR